MNKTTRITKQFNLVLILILVSITSAKAQNWSSQNSTTTELVRCLVPVDQNNVWYSTTGGNIGLTTNGGTNWVLKTKPKNNYTAYTMFAINSSTAWVALNPASGNDFRIAKTTNGGSGWVETVINPLSFGASLYFWNLNEGLTIGYPATDNPDLWVIKRTTDGGVTWNQIPSTNIPPADGVNGEVIPSNSGIAVGDMFMFTSIGNAAFFTPKLYKSRNRGLTWESLPISAFTGMVSKNVYIAFKDTLNGVAVNTAGFTSRTTDGGVSWSEPQSVNTAGFFHINYSGGNTYVICGSPSQTDGLTYVSRDGGVTWKNLGVSGNKKLYNIKFFSNTIGWVSGDNGTLFKWNGGDITYNPAYQMQVNFKINMKYQMKRRLFIPEYGDKVYIRGTFNGWEAIDSLSDPDNDSVYTKLMTFDFRYREEFKFYFNAGTKEYWENDPARNQIFNQPLTEYNGGYFNNDFFFEQLNCSNPVVLTPGQKISASNSGGSNNVTKYLSYDYSSGSYTGPEKVYQIFVQDSCRLIANLTNSSNSNLHVFILTECNPYIDGERSINGKAVWADAKPGFYYVVVDGWQGATGSYDLTVQCQSGKPTGNIVWFEDFEQGAEQRWLVTAQEWGIGKLRTDPWRPAFGSKCAKTNLYGNYLNDRNTYLYRQESFRVPPKDQNPRLSYWSWFANSAYDYGVVRIRVDRGNGQFSNWTNISSEYRDYSSNVWSRNIITLNSYADSLVQIGFFFHSERVSSSGNEDEGWAIDNVSVVSGDYNFEDQTFDGADFAGLWSADGSWEIGMPTYGPLEGGYSSPNCAGTKLNGNYDNDADDCLESPYIVIPPVNQNPRLKFRQWYRFSSYDNGKVQIIDEASGTITDIPGAYFEGISTGWGYPPSFDLSAYSGKKLRIRFLFVSRQVNSASNADNGWYIDDVKIEPINHISLTSLNGGNVIGQGSVQRITWFKGEVSSVNLKYTTDDGATWLGIASSISAAGKEYLWTVPGTPSRSVRIRIENAASPDIYDLSDTTFTISPSIEWRNTLVMSNSGSQKILTYGLSPSAGDSTDILFNEIELPPMPPAGTFDARFVFPTITGINSYNDFRKNQQNIVQWIIKFQPGTSGYPITLNWNISDFPEGEFLLTDMVNGTLVNVNMKAVNNIVISNTSVTQLKLIYKKYNCYDIQLTPDWGLVSVPVESINMNAAFLFPGLTAPAFSFLGSNGYTAQSVLSPGRGYWMKNNSLQTITICGSHITNRVIPVFSGWNIVGPFGDSVNTGTITQQNTSILTPFYQYNGGYMSVQNLKPGKGYWVKVSTDGTITLPQNPTLLKMDNIIPDVTPEPAWSILTFTDAAGKNGSLYAGKDMGNISAFELPPVPPAGGFDIRYSSGYSVEKLIGNPSEIKLSGAVYPVTVSCNTGQFEISDRGTSGQIFKRTLTKDNPVVISDKSIQTLLMNEIEIPHDFELSQNFPNPFNPVTTIQYSVPEKGRVTLTIYNTLGEKIEELFSEEKEAGSYRAVWNAENYTSGVYVYELKSRGTILVRKMILMK